MRLRRVALPVLALALAGTSVHAPAFAAVKKTAVCNLVVDPPGDGQSKAFGVISSPGLDVLGADVATGAKTIVFVVRVSKTDLSSDTWAPLGYRWYMQVTILGVKYAVERSRTLQSDGTYLYKDTFTSGNTSGDMPAGSSVSKDATSYKWVVPRTSIPGLKKVNQKITDLQAGSKVLSGNADQASSVKTYTDKWPSCLKPA